MVVKKSQPKEAQNIQSLGASPATSQLAREAATSEILRMIATARRRCLRRCSIRLRSEQRDSATRTMLECGAYTAKSDATLLTLDRFLRHLPWAKAVSLIVARPLVEQSLIARRYMSMTFEQRRLTFPATRGIALGLRTVLSTPLLAKDGHRRYLYPQTRGPSFLR